MTNGIALALIKQLVAIGQLDADDISAICDDLPERDKNAVMAAWALGICPDREFVAPFKLLNGGKSEA